MIKCAQARSMVVEFAIKAATHRDVSSFSPARLPRTPESSTSTSTKLLPLLQPHLAQR
jgi:hypothetical protein